MFPNRPFLLFVCLLENYPSRRKSAWIPIDVVRGQMYVEENHYPRFFWDFVLAPPGNSAGVEFVCPTFIVLVVHTSSASPLSKFNPGVWERLLRNRRWLN